MFKNEIRRKLGIKNEMLPFCLNMICRDKMIVSGIKNVLSSSQSQLRLRLNGEVLSVVGEDMQIVEIGGGDIYVKGLIKGVEFE